MDIGSIYANMAVLYTLKLLFKTMWVFMSSLMAVWFSSVISLDSSLI
jgi:hypothetical protein